MPKRDVALYVEDILDSAGAIAQFVGQMSFEEFKNDRKTYSATIREYIVIGEAIASLIKMLEEKIPNYPWRMIKDFRNFIVHEYFGVDAKVIWDLTKLELDNLVKNIESLKEGGVR